MLVHRVYLNIQYAPYTENELGHELIKVIVQSDNGSIEATFELNDECDDYVELKLIYKDTEQSYQSRAHTYFDALNEIRKRLETDKKYPICFGTCENVYPSGMQLDMGVGRLAYKQTLGKQAVLIDIVDIFNSDDSCIPTSIEAQKVFHEKWIQSIINT